MGNNKLICEMCGSVFSDRAVANKEFFISTKACKACYAKLADDENQCFGKQFPNGQSLAVGDECKVCKEQAVCSRWPKNPVIYYELNKEKQMAKKTTKTEPAAPVTEPAAKPAVPAGVKPGSKKATKTRGSSAEVVDYGKDCSFHKGTSLEVAASILTSKKTITLEDAVAQFKKVITDSSNPQGRVLMVAAALRKANVIEKSKSDDGTISFSKK